MGEATDRTEAVAVARTCRPELVLLDLSMPATGGLDALPRIREAAPGSQILVFTAAHGLGHAALGVGADGYVTKGLPGDAWLAEVHAVLGTTTLDATSA